MQMPLQSSQPEKVAAGNREVNYGGGEEDFGSG